MFLSVKFFYLLSSVGKYNFVSYEQAQSEAALYSLPGRLLPPHLWRKPLLVSCKSCPGFFMHINKNMNVYSHPLSFYKCYHIYNVLCFAFLNLMFLEMFFKYFHQQHECLFPHRACYQTFRLSHSLRLCMAVCSFRLCFSVQFSLCISVFINIFASLLTHIWWNFWCPTGVFYKIFLFLNL